MTFWTLFLWCLCWKNFINQIPGSETTNQIATVKVDPAYDHFKMHKIAGKENDAVGTDHLATESTQLGEQEGVCEKEEIADSFEVASQL